MGKLSHAGNWIIIGFIIAAGMLLFLVYKSTRVDVQMVGNVDFYEQEALYDHHLEAVSAANQLGHGINLRDSEGVLTLSIPPRLSHQITAGNVHFYCLPNAKLDVVKELNSNPSGIYTFQKNEVLKGHNYKIKVTFSSGEKEYYKEFHL